MVVAGDPRGYYRTLGVDRTASAEDIKAAFRRQAKGLHPDQGGDTADKETFRRLYEAYEALRDPQRRLRYDSESLEAERTGAAAGGAGSRVDGGDAGFAGWIARASSLPRQALLVGALAVTAIVAVLGWLRAVEQGRIVAELSRRLETVAAAVPAEAPATELPRIYRTEFRFPAGVAELDPGARGRLAKVTADLRREIAALPEGSEWLIGVEGVIERAADGDGLLVAAWELALLRVGVTAQYLVGEGIPAERVSVRFHAGALAPDRGSTQGVALSLFCCLEAPPNG